MFVTIGAKRVNLQLVSALQGPSFYHIKGMLHDKGSVTI